VAKANPHDFPGVIPARWKKDNPSVSGFIDRSRGLTANFPSVLRGIFKIILKVVKAW